MSSSRVVQTLVDNLLQTSADAATFVANATESLSLETLRLALDARIATVQSELVSAINADYGVFVSLSAALDTSDASVRALRAPLADADAALKKVAECLVFHESAVARAEAGVGYAAAATAAAARNDASRAIANAAADILAALPKSVTVQSVSPCARFSEEDVDGGGVEVSAALNAWSREASSAGAGESLMVAAGAGAGLSAWSSVDADLARAHGLFRAATLLARAAALRAVPGKDAGGEAHAVDVAAETGAATVVRRLDAELRTATLAALAAVGAPLADGQHDSARMDGGAGGGLDLCAPQFRALLILHICFLAWAADGERGVAVLVALTVERITAPLLTRLFAKGRLDAGGVSGSYKSAPRVLAEYASEAAASAEALRVGHATPLRGLSGVLVAAARVPFLTPVAALVWAPLVDHLAAHHPSFFSPALPPIFHANYTALSETFSRLRVSSASLPIVAGAGGAEVGESDSLPPSSLLTHASSIALAGVWRPKLSVYAALRGQEAAAAIERALVARPVRADAAAPPPHPPIAWAAPAVCTATLALCGAVEDSETGGRGAGEGALPSHVQYATAAASGTASAIATAWNVHTHFLPPLHAATVSLSVAALRRWAAWAAAGAAFAATQAGVAPRALAMLSGGSGAGVGGVGSFPETEAGLVPLPPALLRALTPAALASAVSSSGGATTASGAVSGDLSFWCTLFGPSGSGAVDALLCVAADADALAVLALGFTLATALERAGVAVDGGVRGGDEGVSDPLDSATSSTCVALGTPLAAAARTLRSAGAYAIAVAAALLARGTVTAAGAVRALPAALRAAPQSSTAPLAARLPSSAAGGASAAPSPTPSPYASALLRPLTSALEALPRRSQTRGARALARTVVSTAFSSLAAAIASALEAQRAQAASLQWLTVDGGAPATTQPALTPEAVRVAAQIVVDVRAVGADAGTGAIGAAAKLVWEEGEGGGRLRAADAADLGAAAVVTAWEGALALVNVNPPSLPP